MSSYLRFTVRFLQPFCHARADGEEPEWPPSPLRLFQALAAAAAARFNERLSLESAVPALRWLEQLPPPSVVAPLGRPAETGYRLYVPDNVCDLLAASWARGGEADLAEYRTDKHVRPTYLDGDAVQYLFPLGDAACPHLETLRGAARSITHLGWGIDMVAGDAAVITEEEAASLAGQHWLPSNDAAATPLRVPTQGTLEDLMRKHDAFLNRVGRDASGNTSFNPVPPLTAFRLVGYRRSTDLAPRPYAVFAFYRPDGDSRRTFATVRAIAVAGMVRSLAGKMARQTGHHDPGRDLDSWVNEYVMGHGDGDGLRPRFSYLPLPTIRPPNVLGGINRVLIAEPPGGAGIHAAWASQVLRGQMLVNTAQREESILLPASKDCVLRQYTADEKGNGYDTWSTVTPVVLPGSDEGKFAKAEKLFFKALRHAGYSSEGLAELEFRNVPYWPRGEPALSFQRPDYLKKGYWSVYHVRLRWCQPVRGPLALGAGRHCGLGVFATLGRS